MENEFNPVIVESGYCSSTETYFPISKVTLLDEFAKEAMKAFIISMGKPDLKNTLNIVTIPELSYEMAIVMLKERQTVLAKLDKEQGEQS